MTFEVRPGRPESGYLGVLRTAALIAVLAGAAGSVGLMLRAGRRNQSQILMLLFGIWVLSPFVAAFLAHVFSKRWPVVARATLYAVMLALTLGSLTIYGDFVFGRLQAKAGSVFLVVPFASWLLIGIVGAMVISGRRSRRGT